MNTICLTLCLFFFSGGQVAKLYRDASLGNVVNIIVTRLIILTEDQVGKPLLFLTVMAAVETPHGHYFR